MISTALAKATGVALNTPLKIDLNYRRKSYWNPWYLKRSMDRLGVAQGFASKVPGMIFSAYSSASGVSPVIISMRDYNDILTLILHTIEQYDPAHIASPEHFTNNDEIVTSPKQKLMMKVKK